MEVGLPRAVRARLDPAERFGLRLTLLGVAIAIVAVPFAWLTFHVLDRGALTRFDGRMADGLNERVHHSAVLVAGLQAVSLLGRPLVLALWVVAATVWTWRAGRRRVAVFLAVTPLGGGIVGTVVKALVDRPRPVVDHPVATAFGKSFPSGHAMSATVTYGALLVAVAPVLAPRIRRAALGATVVLVLAVGLSRPLLGVHFVTDVVGGYLLGAAWLAGAVAAFHTWREEDPRVGSAEARPPPASHGP